MALGLITLTPEPEAGSVTPPSVLVLSKFIGGDAGYGRDLLPGNTVASTSAYGVDQIEGPAHEQKFLWTLVLANEERITLHVDAIAWWQAEEKRNQRLGRVRLLDEWREFPARPATGYTQPFNRQITSPSAHADITGYNSGFGSTLVLCLLPADFQRYLGKDNASGEQADTVTVQFQEISE